MSRFSCVKYIVLFATAIWIGSPSQSVSGTDDIPSRPRIDDAEVARHWINQLNSDNYQERETATRELAKLGSSAVAVVVEALRNDHGEVAWRSRTILEHVGSHGDPETLRYVTDEMSKLVSEGHTELAESAGSLTQLWIKHRSEGAIREIEAYGVKVESQPVFQNNIFAPPGARNIAILNRAFAPNIAAAIAPVEDAAIKIDFNKIQLNDKEIDKLVQKFEDEKNELVQRLEVKALAQEADELKQEKAENGAPQVDPPKARILKPAVPIDAKPIQFNNLRKEAAQKIEQKGAKIAIEFNAAPPVKINRAIPIRGAVNNLRNGVVNSSTPVARMATFSHNWNGDIGAIPLLNEIENMVGAVFSDVLVNVDTVKALSKTTSVRQLTFDQCDYDSAAVRALVKVRPDIQIAVTGVAFLGVTNKSNDDNEEGVTVSSVLSKSGAARAGISPNDVITAVDGTATPDFISLCVLIARKSAGEKVAISFIREGEKRQEEVVLLSRDGIQ